MLKGIILLCALCAACALDGDAEVETALGSKLIEDLLAADVDLESEELALERKDPSSTIAADLDTASETHANGDATYYVSPDGSDEGDGSEASPFLTIQKCVDSAKAAKYTMCILRSGRYPDVVTIKAKGRVRGGLIITGHKDDPTTPIIDGTISMDSLTWTAESPSTCKYRSSVWPDDIKPYQLFFNKDGVDTPFTPARWPNAKLSDYSAWAHSVKGSGEGPLCYSSDDSDLPCKDGTSVDEPAGADEELMMVFSGKSSSHDELLQVRGSADDGADWARINESGIDFTDTMVVMAFGAMATQTTGCRVKTYNVTGGYLTYTLGEGFYHDSSTARGHNGLPFFFEGHPKLLDSDEEWSFDTDTSQYLVQTWKDTEGACVDPATLSIRGKVVDANLELRLSTVLIKGVTLFGTTFKNEYSKLTLDHITMHTPTFNKRTVGDGLTISETYLDLGTDLGTMKMTNSQVLFHDAPSLFDKVGDDFVFTNNLVKGSCYGGCSTATISTLSTPLRSTVSHNTITHLNAISAVSPSTGSTIEYNYISDAAVEFDAACIHVQATYTEGTRVAYNWVLSSVVKSLRCDRVNAVDAELGNHTTIVNNVAYKAGPVFIKGDGHVISNNVVIDSPDAEEKSGSLAVMMVGYSPPLGSCGSTNAGGWGITAENNETQMHSNVADSFISVYPDCDYAEFPPDSKDNLAMGQCGATTLSPKVWKNEPCTGMDNKWWETEFVDAAGFDFRPKSGTQSATLGAGAYAATMTDEEYAAAKPGASGYGATNTAAVDPESYDGW